MHLSNEHSVSGAGSSIPPTTAASSLGTPLLPLLKGTAWTIEDEYIQGVVSKIMEAYSLLASLPSLEPSVTVNQAFGRLVEVAVQIPPEDVANKVSVCLSFICSILSKSQKKSDHILMLLQILAHPDIARITPNLQQLCSKGEYELEKFWANRIARAETEREGKLNQLLFSSCFSVSFQWMLAN